MSGVVDRNLIAPGLVLIALLVCVACILRMRALRHKSYAKWRRIGGMIVLSVMILIAAAVGTGATFDAVAAQYFFARHPARGKFYDVGGYKMHLYCTGEGSPALVADAGLSNDSLIRGTVQPEISKITRVFPMIVQDLAGVTRGLTRVMLTGSFTSCMGF
jgi:hypothetical protein